MVRSNTFSVNWECWFIGNLYEGGRAVEHKEILEVGTPRVERANFIISLAFLKELFLVGSGIFSDMNTDRANTSTRLSAPEIPVVFWLCSWNTGYFE